MLLVFFLIFGMEQHDGASIGLIVESLKENAINN